MVQWNIHLLDLADGKGSLLLDTISNNTLWTLLDAAALPSKLRGPLMEVQSSGPQTTSATVSLFSALKEARLEFWLKQSTDLLCTFGDISIGIKLVSWSSNSELWASNSQTVGLDSCWCPVLFLGSRKDIFSCYVITFLKLKKFRTS